VLVHALYLVNLASPDDEIYGKSASVMRSTMEAACAIEADGVVFHVGSHLGAGFEHGLERVVPALEQVVALCRHARLGVCLDTCHLWVSGYDVTDAGAVDALLAEVDGRIGLDRLRALHVNDARDGLGSNRDRHANLGDGVLGDRLTMMLGHPAVRDLPAVLEVPGPDNHGPDANEVTKLRELCKRATRRRRR
jgi:deoxyribonuclease-4